MNTEILFKELPIINIYNNKFNTFRSKINKSIVNKHVVYRVYDKNNLIEFYGKVISYENNIIKFCINDYISEYSINQIKEIEILNFRKKYFKKYINKIVRATNIYGNNIICFIVDVDNYNSIYDEITFYIKTMKNELMLSNYPICLIKSMKVVGGYNE